jgi:predicted N-acetyltransferase YhbS
MVEPFACPKGHLMIVRLAAPTELTTICTLHRDAFGIAEGDAIAALVDHLAHDPTATPSTSLVAEIDGTIVGHVLFTAVHIPPHAVRAQILAPLGVAHTHHRHGIGTALVRAGLTHVATHGCDLVFVYGNPAYYNRFGFVPATPHGLIAPYPIPHAHADAWMVQALSDNLFGNVHGTIQCATTLHNPQYW